ncbi:hypothetical protein [Shimia sp. MMG029]|uniref:hypothetical protein n=1 Tax=Shimia sp. MMG029 TaxID=3021978 RepID=UPI0022FF28BF|nr:hypothetical protein [Shimia sp. MMG029]MDA5555150.1 hypothetical protein [Shimia sp. MMG029]
MFTLFLPAVLALMALCAILWLPEAARSAENLPVLFLALLVHLPAFLPVSQHGKLLTTKVKLLNTYPEVLIPPCLAIAWFFIGGSFQVTLQVWLFAAVTLSAICLCYAAVRICDAKAARIQSEACRVATMPPASTADIAKRHIYLIRCALTALSLTAIFATAADALLPRALLILPVALSLAAVALTALTLHQERSAHAELAPLLRDLMARQLQASPAQVAVYHAGTSKADISATKALCEHLNEAHEPYVLIVRERGALEDLQRLSPRHLWHAEKLGALADCVQPQLRTILYAQDHPKNSHFTRNTQFEHVLITAFNQLERAPALPQTVALYQKILAPTDAHARNWQSTATLDLASRIVTKHQSVPDLYAPRPWVGRTAA